MDHAAHGNPPAMAARGMMWHWAHSGGHWHWVTGMHYLMPVIVLGVVCVGGGEFNGDCKTETERENERERERFRERERETPKC